MAEQRLLAAFYLSLAARPTPSDLPELMRRADIEVVRTPHWGPSAQPVLGRWGGLDCEISLLALSYYDVLLVTFRQDEFRALFAGYNPDSVPQGARAILDAFAASCRSLSPIAAILTSYAWVEPAPYLTELEERVIAGDIPSLTREHIWLLYVPSEDVELLSSNLPRNPTELVQVPDGAVLITKLDRDDW